MKERKKSEREEMKERKEKWKKSETKTVRYYRISFIWPSKKGKTIETGQWMCQWLSMAGNGGKYWFQKDIEEFGGVMEIYCFDCHGGYMVK